MKALLEVGGIVVGVFDVYLRCDGVVRLEVPVDDLGRMVVVVIGGPMHVFGR